MPRKKKTPKPDVYKDKANAYEKWLDKINNAIDCFRAHPNGVETWVNAYRLYAGNHWSSLAASQPGGNTSGWAGTSQPDSAAARELITVNIISSNINLLLSYVLNKRPTFYIHPERGEKDVAAAQLKEGVINYYWREKDMQEQIRRAALDCYITGHGIIRTGYDLQEDIVENIGEDGSIVYEQFIRADEPYIRAVSPLALIWDTQASQHDLKTSSWLAEVFIRPKDDVLANTAYDKKVRDKISDGTYSIKTPKTAGLGIYPSVDNATAYNEDEMMILYEVWDKKHYKRYVFAADCPEPLLEKNWPYTDDSEKVYLDGFPYIKMDFLPVPWEPFAQGMPFNIIDQQLELNRIRTYMFQHIRRYNRKYQVLVNNLVNKKQLVSLKNGEDGTLIHIKGGPAVFPIEDSPIPQDKYNVMETIYRDIDNISGITDSMRGASIAPRTPATGLNLQAAATNTKLDYYVEVMDNFVTEIAEQILQHCQNFMASKQAIQIVGPTGVSWEMINKQDIQGDFDVSIESASKPRTDPNMERQQFIQLFQTVLLPIIQQAGLQLDWPGVIRLIAKKFNMQELSALISLPPEGATTPPPEAGTTGSNGQAGSLEPTQGISPLQQSTQQGAVSPNSSALGALMGGSANGGGQ